MATWVAVTASGPRRCQTRREQQSCSEHSAVRLTSPHRVHCHPSDNPNEFLLRAAAPPVPAPRVIEVTAVGLYLMAARCLVALTVGMFGWVWRGVIIADLLVPLVVSASLSPITLSAAGDANSWAGSVVALAREMMGNVYTGWDCGPGGVGNNAPGLVHALLFLEVSLAVTWLACFGYLVRFRLRRVLVLLRRFASGWWPLCPIAAFSLSLAHTHP